MSRSAFGKVVDTQVSRRTILQASGLGALGFALAACSGPATGEELTNTQTDDVDWSTITPATEITWWSNHPGSSKDAEDELIRQFTEKTGIAVKLVTAGASYDEVAQRFQAASGTDSLPDLVIASDVWWFRYFLNGQIMPLDGVFTHLKVDTSDYNPTLYGDYEFDGAHYAAPYARSTPLFYYNKDVFKKAGLPDRGPRTWDEFEQWAPKLQEVLPADGAPLGLGVGTSWSAWWMLNVLWGRGATYSNEWDITLNTPEAIAAGEWVRELYHDKKFASIGNDTNADFAAGYFGCLIGSTGSLTGLLDAATFNLGASFLPEGPEGPGVPTGGTGLAIPSSRSPEQQLAAAMFLDFLTNAESTAFFSKSTGYMPVRTSATTGPTMTALYDEIPLYRVAIDQLAITRSQDWVRVFVPSGDQILSEGIEQIVLKNTPAQQAWESITPRLDRAFTENVEPYL
ncbi:ABC transporter substrate-binding protein [Jonesia denitrificans]|uniref:Extracellular solute-binding protein family 1 n=1 Tax=Jonesia denitrificans (strain ATCC 14870 / DSM 20603 / BCRC 15368 / CIP 55.134 / JCM 11481 / NBRC 15587 / NCTC 10816 / Prevot 55134) TaxID=471856 RepID=C7R1Z2_JONDD|nr:ABC transporter substrate-binding protein [Jonesia denitrificans]ACV09880.1 extracellular solute-binding protein family 1 [Jonesia denitrificans DSM 20603]ASE08930.1 ABC transporter substrate-binding protein [Jonesia denitrificans]QXB43476.1 ABC transporter substrate-binding protein [Jonesia denitrificans]SQH22575.1 glycerol-3-phosphate transporter periplasmic binding protein [Jonesia denitrificans]